MYGNFDADDGLENRDRRIKFILNGDSSMSTVLTVRHGMRFDELKRNLVDRLQLQGLKKLRLFNTEGMEILEDDLEIIKGNDVLFFSKGEDFDIMTSFHEYEVKQRLGEGGFGKVYLGVHKETQEQVAIKLVTIPIRSANDIEQVFAEGETLKHLNHDNIVKVLKVLVLRNMHMVIIMEYLQGGELSNYVKQRGKLTEAEARDIFRQLTAAIYYCHKEKLVHRDLKPENILLTNKESNHIKVVDFGIAGMASKLNIDPTECGSLRYMAPEVLSRKNIMANMPIDIWAMGCILYYMLHGYSPFRGEMRKEVQSAIVKGNFEVAAEIRKQISDECFDILHRMLTVDHEKRINIIDLSNHPWINPHSYAKILITITKEMIMMKQEEEKKKAEEIEKSPSEKPRSRRGSMTEIKSPARAGGGSFLQIPGVRPKEALQASPREGAARERRGLSINQPFVGSAGLPPSRDASRDRKMYEKNEKNDKPPLEKPKKQTH
eukprot:TRINITY_DN857_c0_g1_i1.p1 TRINITY_DN857_c0_g1~~TRINITY_DN857_c0_g1_i1.p1  ORF type:complete len:491 (+),score=135.95 TRINITY_DN857_c0_g1_i1:185-1657(+)